MINPITIPPEALKAVTRVLDRYLVGGYTQSDVDTVARVACLAMLAAWQTEKHNMIVGKALDEVGGMYLAIILPLTESDNGKA
jgi:hypothetical protein